MKLNLLFALPLCILFMACSASPEDLTVFKRALESFSHAVRIYSTDAVDDLQLEELRVVINIVDESMLEFEGTAKNHLSNISSLALEQKSFDSIVKLCDSVTPSLASFIKNIDAGLSESDKCQNWNNTVNALNQGLINITHSFDKFIEVKKEREELRQSLCTMKSALTFDFGPQGVFEQKNQDLILKDLELKSQIASDLRNKFMSNGIDHQYNIEIMNCLEKTFTDVQKFRQEKLNKVKESFKPLQETIERAIELATIPDFNLDADKTNIYSLQVRIFEEGKKQKVILENDPNSQAELLPLLKALINDCYKNAFKI
ncbi:uncharacterized protein [Drosophila bipectinata]|uniref:uncharacterized protein n=1 Tax=Drosophila bipectinata TaxID=42026 RepID=UPI0038B30697